MKEKIPLGLAELIEQVKHDLLSTETDASIAPLFSVDEINLELAVSFEKSANAGISISVLQLGGAGVHSDAQRINVRLTPLLGKEERIAILKQRHPELWADVENASTVLNRGLGE